jgi:DedD protein
MENGLKQRIIGALVLVVAAVVFLPMLLSGQDETVEVQVEVPAAPTMNDSELVAAPPPTLPEPAAVAEIPQPADQPSPVAPEPSTEIALVSPAPSVVEPEPEVAPQPTPSPSAGSTAPAVAASDSWVIQQGSFSSQSNAERFRKVLADQGYNAYTRDGQAGGNTIVRVYVGPLSSREAAARIRDELERRHQSKGLVVAHDDATRAP